MNISGKLHLFSTPEAQGIMSVNDGINPLQYTELVFQTDQRARVGYSPTGQVINLTKEEEFLLNDEVPVIQFNGRNKEVFAEAQKAREKLQLIEIDEPFKDWAGGLLMKSAGDDETIDIVISQVVASIPETLMKPVNEWVAAYNAKLESTKDQTMENEGGHLTM